MIKNISRLLKLLECNWRLMDLINLRIQIVGNCENIWYWYVIACGVKWIDIADEL